jgi:protein SCO1/2
MRAVALGLSLLLLSTAFAGCIEEEGGYTFNGNEYDSRGQAADFNLTDQYGENITLSQFSGKVVIVAFTYTACPDVCLVIEANMLHATTEVNSSDLILLSITIDPERDTPEHMANWTETYGYDWSHLSSENAGELEAVYADWHMLVIDETEHEEEEEYEVGHSTLTFIVDRDGNKRVVYSGVDWSAAELIEDIEHLLTESATPED